MEPCKLFIQIPCYNEEAFLPTTLDDIPRHIPGISAISVVVIDDGSTDNTVERAREKGVQHFVRLKKRRGLAVVFASGLDACLKLGADIIVNLDADNQYRGEDIERLVRPILEKKADMVIGNRDIEDIAHFSRLKKRLQRFGSRVVKVLSGLNIPDATTGFRAYSREAALKLNIISEFTYTLETIIQAGNRGVAVENIEVTTNRPTRPSRLFKNMWEYVFRSMATLFRVYTMYRPLKVFLRLGLILFILGVLIGIRFLYYFILFKGAAGHIQSLILAAILIILGFQIILLGLLADLIASNRRLLEDTLSRVKKIELDSLHTTKN